VWRAITDPKHVAQWYGGEGFSSPVCEMDVRPGGEWRHVMRAPNGMEFPVNSVFIEVTPPERLVWTSSDAEAAKAAGKPVNVTTVTLEARGAQTHWTMEAPLRIPRRPRRRRAHGLREHRGPRLRAHRRPPVTL